MIASRLVTTSYHISTDAYEGPIDLFYDLVVADRIDPSELSLSRLVEGFLTELAEGTPVELEHISEFVLVLALLCRLKARRMLGAGRDLTEEEPIANPDRELWFRLAHVTFAGVMEEMAERLKRRSAWKARQVGPDWSKIDTTPDLAFRLDSENLVDLLTELLSRSPSIPDLDHLAMDLPTVEEATAELWRMIGKVGDSSFGALALHCADRVEQAAWFMGLMELVREGKVRVSQSAAHNSISVRRSMAAASIMAGAGLA